MEVRSIREITVDSTKFQWQKAQECLRALTDLPQNDLARPDYRCAAQVFATLALADVTERVG